MDSNRRGFLATIIGLFAAFFPGLAAAKQTGDGKKRKLIAGWTLEQFPKPVERLVVDYHNGGEPEFLPNGRFSRLCGRMIRYGDFSHLIATDKKSKTDDIITHAVVVFDNNDPIDLLVKRAWLLPCGSLKVERYCTFEAYANGVRIIDRYSPDGKGVKWVPGTGKIGEQCSGDGLPTETWYIPAGCWRILDQIMHPDEKTAINEDITRFLLPSPWSGTEYVLAGGQALTIP